MKLVLDNLSKSYGDHEVLKNISFEFTEGKIYGLLKSSANCKQFRYRRQLAPKGSNAQAARRGGCIT